MATVAATLLTVGLVVNLPLALVQQRALPRQPLHPHPPSARMEVAVRQVALRVKVQLMV